MIQSTTFYVYRKPLGARHGAFMRQTMQRNVKIGIFEPISRVYWEMKRARSRDLRRTETAFSQIDSMLCARIPILIDRTVKLNLSHLSYH